MIIYLDIIFFENMILDLIILIITGKIRKIKMNKIRIIIASLLGSIYAVLKIIKGIDFGVIEKVFIAVIMNIIAFYPQNVLNMLKTLAIFITVTFIIGGLNLALVESIGIKNINITILSGIMGSFLIRKIMKYNKEKLTSKDFIVNLEIKINNKIIKLKAFVDSGNQLKDPFTKESVVIIQKDKLDYEKIINGGENRIRIIPYKSVGSDKSIMLGIKPDYIKINNIKKENVVLAFCDNKISKNYEALVSYDLIN